VSTESPLCGGCLEAGALVFERPDPEQERSREALCVLGNGRFATRGSACERLGSDEHHYPGTYLAGVYDRLESTVEGKTFAYEEIVNAPNWLPVLLHGSGTFVLDERAPFLQRLMPHTGVFERRVVLRDDRGRRLHLHETRVVSRHERSLALQRLVLRPEGWSGTITLSCMIDGQVANTNAAEFEGQDRQHFLPHEVQGESDGQEGYWLRARTRSSRIELALAARVALEGAHVVRREPLSAPCRAGLQLTVELRDGQRVQLTKFVSIASSRDVASHEPLVQARRTLARVRSFDVERAAHERVWERDWSEFVLEAPDHPRLSAVLRLHAFHVIQSVPDAADGLDASVGARGLHGENYRGHVFWDELLVLPMLTLRWPQLVRHLLLYRYRRLPEARAAARAAGFSGAMFPWRSASDGRDVCEPFRRNPRSGHWIPDHSRLERHISAAIAYNVWRYYEASDDCEFMSSYGAELLLSIAQFWSSAARLEPQDGRYHLRAVVGPDEFHDAYPGAEQSGIDDNAYTNVMAVWCLLRALDACALLPGSRRSYLLAQLEIDDRELARWQDVSRRMVVHFHDGDVISQFAGFEQLEAFDWERAKRRYGNIKRLDNLLNADGSSTNRYQVCKQPDVLMLFYLHSVPELRALFSRLDYDLSEQVFSRNYDYYRARTSDGSTLSRVVAAWVATKLDRRRSWPTLCAALGVDLTGVEGAAASEGVHLGSMAGTIDVIQRAYLGIEARRERLHIDPMLPAPLSALRASVCYRGQWLELEADKSRLRVHARADGSRSVSLELVGERHELAPGGTAECVLQDGD
jgi:alpha,alpha-trehalase